jgi:hypothetical protein
MKGWRARRPNRSSDAEDEAERIADEAVAAKPDAANLGRLTMFGDVRLHRDARSGGVTHGLGADAVTIGRNIYFSPAAPSVESHAGKRLLAHELAHVVQQREHGPVAQLFQTSERSQIAPTLDALMAVLDGIANRSLNWMGLVSLSSFAARCGAQFAGGSSNDSYELTLRYLFTRRAGLIDMRHFVQLMYLSGLLSNSGATAAGIAHEETAEAASKYGGEDLTSNALGAWTGTQLRSSSGDFSRSFGKNVLLGRIRATLERSAPVDFNLLSASSQQAVVDFYGRLQAGTSGEPVNQNRTAVALIVSLPELAGTDRSFPFELDQDDRTRSTVTGAAFDRGAAGLTGDSEIRSFVHTQRDEVIRGIPQAEKVRLCTRLLQGWVDDSDIVAFQHIYRLSNSAERIAIRAAYNSNTPWGPIQKSWMENFFRDNS